MLLTFLQLVKSQYGTISGNTLTKEDQKKLVQYMNGARASVGSAPLEWDTAMEAAGVQCLNKYSNGQMEHGICKSVPGLEQVGENLMSGGTGADAAIGFITELCQVTDWTTFIKPNKYNFQAGHYSQIVWNTSKKVSCVQVVNNGVIYCHYSPPGNMIGSAIPPISNLPDLSLCKSGKLDTKAWIAKYGNGTVPEDPIAPTLENPSVKIPITTMPASSSQQQQKTFDSYLTSTSNTLYCQFTLFGIYLLQ